MAATATQNEQGQSIDRATVRKLHVEDLFLTADEIKEEYDKLLDKRNANREELRNQEKMGYLNATQKRQLEKLYPMREVSEESKKKRAATRARNAAAQQQAASN